MAVSSALLTCGQRRLPYNPMTDPLWLSDGPTGASWHLILAHGAGQGIRSSFMDAITQRLGASGLHVYRFLFPYMARTESTGTRRPPDRQPVLLESWQQAIERAVASGIDRRRLLIGGKSLGGRMASLIADAQGVAGLVCLGYPFYPPGRPQHPRSEHLTSLVTPTLICQGTRDPMGSREEVSKYSLSPAIRFAWIEDGEHSFRPRKASARTWEQNLAAAADAVAQFVHGLAA
jgi:predicted alpha/beta-hydrolase family hydrolase